jgi:hypothetical protein
MENLPLALPVQATELADVVQEAVAKAFRVHYPHFEPLIQVHDLANELDVGRDLVRRWVHQGCPCIRAGRKKLRFRMSDVIAWLDDNTKQGAA